MKLGYSVFKYNIFSRKGRHMNTLKTIFVALLLYASIYSQTSGTYDENPSVIQEIERYYDNTYQYNRDNPVLTDDAWAGKNGQIATMNTFRLIYTWYLNIPSNAMVNSCTLYVAGTSYSNAQPPITNIQWQIKKFPDDKFNAQPSEQWASITSAEVLRNEVVGLNIPFQGSPIVDQTFLTYIQNSLATQRLHISIRGTDEETWGTNRNIHYIDFQYSNNPVITALRIKINYTVPSSNVSITADNNFIASGGANRGTMVIDGVNRTIPLTPPGYTFQKTVGQNLTLSANSPQNDNQGYQRIWHTGSINRSIWDRNGEYRWPNQTYSFNVAADDDGKRYTANLRKNYAISRNDQTEFNGTIPNPNLWHIVDQNSGQISAPDPLPGYLYNYAGWGDDLSAPRENRTIWPNGNETYSALYKYPNHSNNVNAFSINSQKKLVRDSVGNLHKVYSSMGYVWYEKSTDNGATWLVKNHGKPLSSNEAKLPAIDYYGNYIFITWQERYEDSYKIRLAYYPYNSTDLVFHDVYDASYWGICPYSDNATPVIAWAGNRILIAFKFNGIVYRYGYLDCYEPITWYTSEYETWVPGTDQNSTNPTIAVRKDGGTTVFHLAWQQSTTTIKYRSLTVNGTNLNISPEETPSSGDAYSYKRDPSISVVGSDPTLVWVGSTYFGATTRVFRRVRIRSNWGSFTIYGTNAESPTEYNSRVVWSEGNVNKLYHPWKGFRTLSTVGKSVQLSTGTMYAVAYRQFSPYDFTTSQDIETLTKLNSFVNECGREAIVRKGEAEFYFIIGDVFVDNEIINYSELEDTTIITSTDDLNLYMKTNTFSINESSDFTFSIAYGAVDSLKALNELTGGSSIQFKLELVDAATNEVVGELGDFILDDENIHTCQIHSYQVNTQGLGNRTVKLHTLTSTNFDGAYNLADILAEEEVLGKRSFEELNLTGESLIISYDLFQNYPNPFNPSTTIKYQIPEDGLVTLKVYDVLGGEVKSLVNEQQSAGRYEVNVNASDLSSGVYIYKIQVNDFISSKKMILLK
jgi:hypothetical protein